MVKLMWFDAWKGRGDEEYPTLIDAIKQARDLSHTKVVEITTSDDLTRLAVRSAYEFEVKLTISGVDYLIRERDPSW